MIHVLSHYSQLRDRHQEVTVIHGRSQCQGTVKTRPTIGTHHPQQVVAAKLVQPFSSEGNPKSNSGWPVKHARAQTQCETDRPCLAPSSHHIYRLLRSHRCAAQREVVGRSWLQVSTQLLADGHVLGLTFVRHSKQQLRPSNHLLFLLCSPLVATSKSTAWWAGHTRLQPSPVQSRQIIQYTEAKRLRHLTISHNNFQSANLNLVRSHL